MRDLGQSTQEQVEYVKGQNNALQAQLKRERDAAALKAHSQRPYMEDGGRGCAHVADADATRLAVRRQ